MTGPAIVMMIVICTLVWGGFITFLAVVGGIEKRKSGAPPEGKSGRTGDHS